jgi:hypothetical protein
MSIATGNGGASSPSSGCTDSCPGRSGTACSMGIRSRPPCLTPTTGREVARRAAMPHSYCRARKERELLVGVLPHPFCNPKSQRLRVLHVPS